MSKRIVRVGYNRNARGIVIGGAIAGIVAGIVMAIVTMLYTAMLGLGFFAPVRWIAAGLIGVEALIGGFGVVLLGLVLHVLVSAVLGIIFAGLLPARAAGGMALGLGVIFGVVVWAVMTWAVLPLVNPTMAARVMLTPFAWFVQHLIFGVVLATTPGLISIYSVQRPPERGAEPRAA